MINNLDNISIFYLIIISILPALILYYEKKNYSKDKQYNIFYYIQWTLISFILIILGVVFASVGSIVIRLFVIVTVVSCFSPFPI